MNDYTYKLPALKYTINCIGDIQKVDDYVECASRRHSARTIAITDSTASKDKNSISKPNHKHNSNLRSPNINKNRKQFEDECNIAGSSNTRSIKPSRR